MNAFRLVLIIGFLLGLTPWGHAADRPNIIFLLTDDQRYDDLGCTGNAVIQTPNIDKLAARGVLFSNFHVTSPVCAASRATYFTGQVERSHGSNFYFRDLSPSNWATSYPLLLRRAGYFTGFIGKFGVKVEGLPRGLPKEDFDVWHGFSGQGPYFPKGEDGPHMTSIMGEQAVGFIRKAVEESAPFCLSVSFKAPHDPLTPDPKLDGMYRDAAINRPPWLPDKEIEGLPATFRNGAWLSRVIWHRWFSTPSAYKNTLQQRYRLISGVDRAIGKILRELEASKVTDRTVIVFASDNGFYYGEHGLGMKFYLHDVSTRVPLIVVDPALPRERCGQVVDALTANIDIAPSFLDWAGVKSPESVQGRSLLSLLGGENTRWRESLLCENLLKDFPPLCESIRTREWKYIRYFKTNPVEEELYALREDPHERNNLSRDPEYASVKRGLEKKLAQLRERYSREVSGYPAWIDGQKEIGRVESYRSMYEKLVRRHQKRKDR